MSSAPSKAPDKPRQRTAKKAAAKKSPPARAAKKTTKKTTTKKTDPEKKSGATVTIKKDPPPQPVEAAAPEEETSVTRQLLSTEDFKDALTEKYGLREDDWWKLENRDKQTKRLLGITWILRQRAIEHVAEIERIEFSDPVYHEKPGASIVYDFTGGIAKVIELGENKAGRSMNWGRYALQGTATSPARKRAGLPRVSAFASASEGAPGDGAGYSAFIAAHNRLKARLVLACIGANSQGIYGEGESPDLDRAAERPADPSANVSSETTPTPAASQAQPTGTPPRVAAPSSSTAARASTAPAATTSKKSSTKSSAKTSAKKAEATTTEAPDGDPAPGSADWWSVPIAKRTATYLKHGDQAEVFGFLLEEIEKTKNHAHMNNVWPHVAGVADKLEFPDDIRQELVAARDAKKAVFAKGQSIVPPDEPRAGAADTPQQLLAQVVEEFRACETLDELRDAWERNGGIYTRFAATKVDLAEEMTRVKEEMKRALMGKS